MDTLSLVQNALGRSHVPELVRIHARPELGHDGRAVAIEGDQAIVTRIVRSDGTRLALRVAISPDQGHDWHLRYAEIGPGAPAAIASHLPRAISVLPGGLSLQGAAHEAVLMEWVDGPTLLHAVDRAARAGNGAVLRALAASLREVATALRRSRTVHGDLAADNLMMRPNGDLVLVDLDDLTWPGARLGPAGHGTPGYRHPAGAGSAAERDAFAALVLFVSLHALADDPDLRRSWGDPVSTHGGVLLFSAWDLADPRSSRAFGDARERATPATLDLIRRLGEACIAPAAQAMEISSDVFGLDEDPVKDEPPVDEATTRSWDLSSVIQRLRSQYGPGDRATQTQETAKWSAWSPLVEPEPVVVQDVRPSPATPPLQALAEDRERLRRAIASGNEQEVVRLAAHLGDDPVARMYKIDVERILAAGYRARIAEAARQQRDDTVLTLADEIRTRNLPLDASTRAHVRRAKERLDVRRQLAAALAADDRQALAHLAVSGQLVVLGDADRASLQQVLRALEWPGLQRVLETDDDALILEWYDEELFGQDASLPPAARERLAVARDRLAWLEHVRAALKRRDARSLAQLFTAPPAGADRRLTEREQQRAIRIIERQGALDDLQIALRSEDDDAILTALHRIERVGARLGDSFAWGTVRRVVERATVVEEIVAAAADPIDDRQLASLLPVARTLGLAHDPRLQGELAFERLEALVLRGAAVRRIRAAIASDDDATIRQAAFPDVAEAHQMLTEAERARIEAAVSRPRTLPRQAAS